ncbi:Cse1-domain-containing protein [Artomyces pyxidatus]|uniref:Cse1-domain-containing protein n=1 Tax=Artomyces pyxidatus TaxID=48021 RepID=A0ACB8SI74_9AGAM|nr:Cse1-domain-containing protein [Artomyces pyxidatus]
MADIPSLLLASLSPQTRKQAEISLQAFSRQPAFLTNLLQLVLNPTQDRAVRLAGSVYLKNVVKLGWMDDDEFPIPAADKETLKPQLVPAMIALSAPTEKAIRAQIAEAISLIAELDFPHAWPDLVDQLIMSLNPEDFNVNVGVLETAHSIFRSWRSQSRSDELWSTIKSVNGKFLSPFLQIFRFTMERLLSNPPLPQPTFGLLAQTMAVLVEIFYDFTCQDLPPELEDSHDEFFNKDRGHFMRLMAWDPTELQTDADEATPSIPSNIRTTILEIAEMYVKLYPEVLAHSSSVEAFVRAVWELVGGGKQLGIAYDQLVSQSLRFISTAIRSGSYKDLFGSRATISGLIEGVVVPNVAIREHDLESFEDTPLEFVRGDLLISDIATPRQAAGDVIKALVSSGFEADATAVVLEWVARGLESYATSGPTGWKSKDSAVYLFEAVASLGSTTTLGVTSTNPLVSVVQFFAENIFQDLQTGPQTVHPVLQVDAIKYLYTFRNQLTKEQLVSVLPLLTARLSSENTVVYTYAAVAIDRILSIRVGGSPIPMFNSADIREVAPQLVDVILRKVESGSSPEKVSENDFVMRCVARVVITARQVLADGYETLLTRLINILGIISKNPSNPNFDQYIFETISALIRFVVPAKPESIGVFEGALFAPFTIILQQDIDQYIPYAFQILAQMLALHSGVPTDYRSLLPFLLTPAIWQQKGSIPGLVKLLQAFLKRDSAQMVATGQFTSVLGIVQQRLIPSKINDGWGFELLQAVVHYIPPADLQQYLGTIFITLLTRMQSSKTDGYVYHFVHFLLYAMAINVDGLTPDFVIRAVEGVQPGLWSQICNNFIIPQTPKLVAKDRKLAVVGLTRMLTQSSLMLQEPSIKAWPGLFTTLVLLFKDPQFTKTGENDAAVGYTSIDLEEQAAGYQAAYSRLAAAEAAPADPVAHVGDVKGFVGHELSRLVGEEPRVKALIQGADQEVVSPFMQGFMGGQGN